MKMFFLIPVVSSVLAVAAWAAPASLENKIVEVCVRHGQEATADMGAEPVLWTPCKATSLYLHFPLNCHNSYRYQLVASTQDAPWPPVTVTYVPESAAITISGNDMAVEIRLRFHSDTAGSADLVWQDESGSWYVRGASFYIHTANVTAGYVAMPQAEATDGAVQGTDDGLGELVRELEARTYNTAVERLYQKRLLTILPQIMEGGDVNNVLSDANGTTALHNACGLSHVEIVQWLVDHGADVHAKTAKGARPEDCVGGPHAKAIYAILKKAQMNTNR